MFCPRCSSKFEPVTSYCRKCGLSLAGVEEIINGEAASAPEVRRVPNGKTIRIGIGLFILGTVLGLANIIVRDLALFPELYGKILFLTFIIAGMLLLASSFLFPQTRFVKRKNAVEPGKHDEIVPSTAPLYNLPSADRNVGEFRSPKTQREPGSVTENTTRNLR